MTVEQHLFLLEDQVKHNPMWGALKKALAELQ